MVLKDKKAIITGAGSGIGKAIALLFAEKGAQVFLLDKDAEAGGTVVQRIESAGGSASFFSCDVTSQQEIKTLFNQIAPFHILVNNAGIAHIGNAVSTTEEDFDKVLSVNVKGVYHCLHAAIPIFLNQGGGVILNMCSVAARVGLQDRFAYSMSKGAVAAMTLSVAKDYLPHGIRCNSISPARVHTPFVDGFIAKNYPGREAELFEKLSKSQPIGRMGKPEEIAALAAFLCSDEAAFITGTDYPIDGGFLTLNT
jgi:NAD(P)-dependent dehydrogenase (short-subunit alcohol dehydrogenase family)